MPRVRFLRLANPLVRAILGSPAHRLLSGRLLVLTYRGHRSGRSFAIPLLYAEQANGEIVVLALRDGKLWWRSFARAAPAVATLRGAQVSVSGAVVDEARRDGAVAAYLERHRYAARRVGETAAVVVLRPTR